MGGSLAPDGLPAHENGPPGGVPGGPPSDAAGADQASWNV
jgi:hypothetical protein